MFLPRSVFYDPQLQIICCYIARYYVRQEHVRLGVIKDSCSLSLGGGGSRTDPKFCLTNEGMQNVTGNRVPIKQTMKNVLANKVAQTAQLQTFN